MHANWRRHLIGGLVASLSAASASAGPILFQATGANQAAIQATVENFRPARGNPNTGNTPTAQWSGRREITWAGGGPAATPTIFANPQTNFSARGSIFTSPGGFLETSGAVSPEFVDINPTYPDIFTTFSAPRLFAPLNSTITDVFFTVPGTTNVPAFTRGFGAIFTDVDLANISSIEFFDPFGQSLQTSFVQPFNNGLSFLGVIFDAAFVSRVRITTGNTALGPNDGSGVD